jgi:hypothetical protein
VASCAINHFISDHDPSGFDLQRVWEETLYNFDALDIAKAVPADKQVGVKLRGSLAGLTRAARSFVPLRGHLTIYLVSAPTPGLWYCLWYSIPGARK